MRTQTKCTLSLCGLFIVEILPVPFTAIYCLYCIRKRPGWIPGVVERLYEEKELKEGEVIAEQILEGHDSLVTRRRCTIGLTTMFLIDIIVPFTVPFGIYIVRKRPTWFKNVVNRLYADQLGENAANDDAMGSFSVDDEVLQQKYLELQQRNFAFARSVGSRAK